MSRGNLDITDGDQVKRVFEDLRPEVVINAAAYTSVDGAESDSEAAMAVNRDGVKNLARCCRQYGVKLIHVSTDFVFDGLANTPIPPSSSPNPISVYGRSKAEGEAACLEELGEEALIVRSAWVYASGYRNFVATMIRLMNERDEISVVEDQLGTPTWAGTLATAIYGLNDAAASGIHHVTDNGVASWYEFAVAIRDIGVQSGLVRGLPRIRPIRSADYVTPASRPAYGVLDNTSTCVILGSPAPHWRSNLEKCLEDWRQPQ